MILQNIILEKNKKNKKQKNPKKQALQFWK